MHTRTRRTVLAASLAAMMAAMPCHARADGGGDAGNDSPVIRPLMVLRPQAGAPNEAELLIYGDIGESWWGESVTALSIVQELQALDPGITQINVRINSYGGSVSDGLAIYNTLRRHSARKVVTVDGVAMSSASLIAMAGDEVQMPAASMLMVHAPWGLAQGNAQDMRIMADVLDTYAEAMAGAYARKTGQPQADMLKLLQDGQDHYYTGDQAVAQGFADAIIDPQADTAGTTTADQTAAMAEGLQRILSGAPEHIQQAARAAAACHPRQLPQAGKPRVTVPAGIDMQDLNRALATASGQRALVAALTTAASANDGDITMKLRKLYAALRDTARDPADGGQGGGGAAAPAPAPAPAASSSADVHAALRARNDEIRAAADPHMARRGVNDMVLGALADPGVTADGFRQQLLDHLGQGATPIGGSARVEAGEDEAEKIRGAGTQFLLARSGVLHGEEAAKARQDNPFNGMTLMDMARDYAARGGMSVRGRSRDEIIRAALTTSDFPNLLENTIHKAIIGGYNRQAVTWNRFCSSGSLSDFRPHMRYYMGGFSDLKEKKEDGEFEHGTLSDADRETLTAKSKGRILTLSREAIINDDMGVFSRAAVMLGQAGARTLEKDVYALLALNGGLGPNMADGNPLFDASHNNVAGTAAAPGTAAFDALRVLLAKQKDASGEYVDIRPAVWVGPTAIGGQARTVNEAQYDTDSSTKQQTPNRSRGLFTDIVDSPRTPDAKRWYGFADPAVEPVIEVGFVDGVDVPQVMTHESFESAGVKWRVMFEYAVGAVSWRGAATNAGA